MDVRLRYVNPPIQWEQAVIGAPRKSNCNAAMRVALHFTSAKSKREGRDIVIMGKNNENKSII